MVHITDLKNITKDAVEVYISDGVVSGQWVARATVNGEWDDIRGIAPTPLEALENWIVSYNMRTA